MPHTTAMHPLEAERFAAEDAAFTAFMESEADARYRDAYETWAADRREDDEDSSEDAYLEYLERMLPDD